MGALQVQRCSLARIAGALTLTLFALTVTIGNGALAQDATPAGGLPLCVNVATPAVADVLQATTDAELAAGTPLADSPVMADTLPAGEPADAETAAAADEVVRLWLACYISGEPLAMLALQSDRMDALFAANYGSDLERYQAMLEADLQATPTPFDSTIVIATGNDIRLLDDGRIGGTWSIDGDAAFVILIQEDGKWVVDDVTDLVDAGTPTP